MLKAYVLGPRNMQIKKKGRGQQVLLALYAKGGALLSVAE